MYYAAIGGIAILINLILNHECFKIKKSRSTVEKALAKFAWAVLFYYLTDVSWGLINAMHLPVLLYIDTALYYIAMALTVVLICRYVTAYLKLKTRFAKIIRFFGNVFGLFEVTILLVNHFVHVFFWVDSQGNYHAYIMRYVALCMQVILCVLLAIEMYSVYRRSIGNMTSRYFTILLFCIEMTIAIILQIFYPMLPIYTVGLAIGICIIHTFVQESEKMEQYGVFKSLADIYYSMNVIDLVNDIVAEVNDQNEVKDIINHNIGISASGLMAEVIREVTVPEYVDAALEFTDLTTVADRMQGKKTMTMQLVGKHIGWFLAMFVTVEADQEGRPTQVIFATRIIEEEKRQEESLIHKSQTDELTGLYNRRAYEEDIYAMDHVPDQFIYIALDVNGLKVVNDSIGHEAGDELIVGASNCLKQVFGPHGKIYRTGGDEFVAITFVSEETQKQLCIDFDEVVASWSGQLIDSLSISYGYVSKEEHPDYGVSQYATEADKRMYMAKTLYYQKKGVDRRGQRDAHRALCEAYTKILKVNLTEDSFQIINMSDDENGVGKGPSDKISLWLEDFGRSGFVHKDDLDEYLKRTDIDYMRQYFKEGNETQIVLYRRKYGDKYRRVMLELIPANDYSHDNQNLFLYVKKIEH